MQTLANSFILLILLGTTGCYSIRQSIHHNDLFNSRRPVADLLADPSVDEKTRSALKQVSRILDFAGVHGLNAEGAYSYHISTASPYVSFLVQAAYPDRFEFKTWWFPVVGKVPYLGFFSEAERDALADQLQAEGFDIHKAGVGAFSSLGWFDDPLFSSMLRRSEPDLAHLLFHELTHRTVWIPGSVEFNENLAEYIAGRLTEEYLLASGKKDQIDIYYERREDKRKFRVWLKKLKGELTEFYSSERKSGRARLVAGKNEIIGRFSKKPLRPEFKRYDYIGEDRWNNASIMGASLYTPDLDMFEKAHACIGHGYLLRFLNALRDSAISSGDGFKGLEALCSNPAGDNEN